MYQVESLHRVSAFDNARNVDLTCALANHFDVDVSLCECGEHSPGDTDHVAHLFSDEREDGHVAVNRNLRRDEYGAELLGEDSQFHSSATR